MAKAVPTTRRPDLQILEFTFPGDQNAVVSAALTSLSSGFEQVLTAPVCVSATVILYSTFESAWQKKARKWPFMDLSRAASTRCLRLFLRQWRGLWARSIRLGTGLSGACGRGRR
jgi:hypothetical protein